VAADPDTSWAIAGHGEGMLVGPARALAGHSLLRTTLSMAEPVPAGELGDVIAERRIAESGLRRFVVTWHAGRDGRTVAVNPAGGNQVSWAEPSRDDIRLTAVAEAHLASVHVRWVLRHLTTTLLEADLAGRSVHAVTATLSGDAAPGARRVLAVAGPTTSGKTRLVNQLIVAGLLDEVVDDDCPVVGADGSWTTLIPRRYEVARATRVELAGLLLLGDAVTEPCPLDPICAGAILERTPVPWPAGWLPTGERNPLPPLPAGVPMFEVPARDGDAYRAVLRIAGSLR